MILTTRPIRYTAIIEGYLYSKTSAKKVVPMCFNFELVDLLMVGAVVWTLDSLAGIIAIRRHRRRHNDKGNAP